MKRNEFFQKNSTSRKVAVLASLLLSLGASLSWNPGYMTIARDEFVRFEYKFGTEKNDSGQFELASKDTFFGFTVDSKPGGVTPPTGGSASASTSTTAANSTSTATTGATAPVAPSIPVRNLGKAFSFKAEELNAGLKDLGILTAKESGKFAVVKEQAGNYVVNFTAKVSISGYNEDGKLTKSDVTLDGSIETDQDEANTESARKLAIASIKEKLSEKIDSLGIKPRKSNNLEVTFEEAYNDLREKYAKGRSRCSAEEEDSEKSLSECIEEYQTIGKECKKIAKEEADKLTQLEELKASQEEAKGKKYRARKINPNLKECRSIADGFYRSQVDLNLRKSCRNVGMGLSSQACMGGIEELLGSEIRPNSRNQSAMYGNVFTGMLTQANSVCSRTAGLPMNLGGAGSFGLAVNPMILEQNRMKCIQDFSLMNFPLLQNDLQRRILQSSNGYFERSHNMLGMNFGVSGMMATPQAGESLALMNNSFSIPFMTFNAMTGNFLQSNANPDVNAISNFMGPYIGPEAYGTPLINNVPGASVNGLIGSSQNTRVVDTGVLTNRAAHARGADYR